MKRFFFLTIFTILHSNSWSKTCTKQTLIDALNKNGRFDFDAENCSNTTINISYPGIQLTNNQIVDGKNKMKLSWTGEGSQCDEIPRVATYASFYTTGNNNILKNFTILKSPEGIHLSQGKGNLVENVVFERICEDAITNGNKGSSSAKDSIIRNVTFKNGPDKAIQCNGGSVTVEGSTFRDIPRAIGACTYKADPGNHVAKECPTVCHIKAYHNKVYGCRGYGFRGAGYLQGKKQGTLTAMNNYFEDCKTPIMASQYGYIYAEDNEAKGTCDQFANTEENGSGDICSNNTKSCKTPSKGNIKSRCIAQNPVPAPLPPPSPSPSPSPGKGVEIYTASGTGGTQQDMSEVKREELACTRAKDRALVNARAQCTSEGKITAQSTDDCSSQACTHSAAGTSCYAIAHVTCDYNGDSTPEPTPEAPPAPTPLPTPSPEPLPEEPSYEWISADGKGGTKVGNHDGGCDLAKSRALEAAEAQCVGNVLERKLSACTTKKQNSKTSTSYTTASVKCGR